LRLLLLLRSWGGLGLDLYDRHLLGFPQKARRPEWTNCPARAVVSAALYSLGHGTNDAQKTMGVIAGVLFTVPVYRTWLLTHPVT